MLKTVINKFCLSALTLVAGGAFAAPCVGPAASYPYPIVVRGEASLQGHSIQQITVMAKKDGKWQSVPFQIDEVNSQGDYVLAGGLPYTKNTDDGIFDANDELALWGQDLGDAVVASDIPVEMTARTQAHWIANFCRMGTPLGTIVVLMGDGSQRSPAAPPQANHVRFDETNGIITTDQYRYQFKKEHPALLGEVVLIKGREEFPVFAKSEFLMPLETSWFLPDLLFRSDDFSSAIESWQEGPVRTIVAVGVKYTSFLGLVRLHLFSELVFYRNRFQIPTVIEFIFDPRSLLTAGSGLAYSLTFPEGRDWEIKSNLERLPAEDPAALTKRKGQAAGTEIFYAAGSRPEGSFLVQVVVDDEARKQVPPPYLIGRREFDGRAWQEHWPWLDEIPGDLGVYLDISMVKKGTYDFGLDLVLSPKAKESFTDYGFVEVEWSRVPIPDFRAPDSDKR